MKLIFGQISKLHTLRAFKTIKVKALSEYSNDSTQPKGSTIRTLKKVFQEFGKIREIARRESVMKYNFNKKADMQYLC